MPREANGCADLIEIGKGSCALCVRTQQRDQLLELRAYVVVLGRHGVLHGLRDRVSAIRKNARRNTPETVGFCGVQRAQFWLLSTVLYGRNAVAFITASTVLEEGPSSSVSSAGVRLRFPLLRVWTDFAIKPSWVRQTQKLKLR